MIGDSQVELASQLSAGVKSQAKSRFVTPEESGGVTVISERSQPQHTYITYVHTHTDTGTDRHTHTHRCTETLTHMGASHV